MTGAGQSRTWRVVLMLRSRRPLSVEEVIALLQDHQVSDEGEEPPLRREIRVVEAQDDEEAEG